MKQRPHVLVVCPQAVAPAWAKVLAGTARREYTPWRHQSEAAAWAAERHASMLALDMGTGKTFTALLALGLDGTATVPVMLHQGANAKRAEQLRQALLIASGKTLVVVVNYDSVWRGELAKLINATPWAAIILDESHRIKSPGGTASRWLAKLAAKHEHAKRLCLTGTPMPHSPLDLWAQFRFLDPQVFGTSYTGMRSRYAVCHHQFHSKVLHWKHQDELTGKLDAHSWRVTADEVLDLPDAIHETVPVELSKISRKFYRTLEAEMTASIDAGTVTAANALTKLLRLSQATGGYASLDGIAGLTAIDGTPSKRLALQDRLEDLHETEQVVVFCRFRSDLDDVQAAARELRREYAEVSGERKDLERWQAGDATILGVQMQSGGVGIDLSRAAYAFYYSLGYSLGDYEQSLARLRRPGQTRCVRYYHLVCSGTVDEQVYAALRERRSVVEAVLQKLSSRQGVVA
jgi:SNF2 family DNA or RNA helicase